MGDVFAFDDSDRDDWAEEGAVAVAAAAAAVRGKVARKLAGYSRLPRRARALFRDGWWHDELDDTVLPAFSGIAAAASDSLLDSLGLDLSPDTRVAVAGLAAAGAIAALASRADTVRDRVHALHKEAAAGGHDPEWLASQLGLDGDSGPLSDDVAAAMGRSAATGIVNGTATRTLTEVDDTKITKQWRAIDDHLTRATHSEAAAGDPIDIGDYFTVGDGQGMYPGDEELPVEETAGCRCWLEYEITVNDVVVDDEEEEAVAASASQATRATALNRQRLNHANGKAPAPEPHPISLKVFEQLAEQLGLPTGAADALAAVAAAFAVDTSRVVVTVEPTAAEKQGLAAVADTVAELHVPLLDVGDLNALTPDTRIAMSTALVNVAAVTPPLSGTIAGTGYLEDRGVTVGIVDCPGLGDLRDAVAAALFDLAPEPGEFLPVVVLSAGSVDATQIGGVPVHFNELRVRAGAETLVFDLLGPIPVAPTPTDNVPPEPAPVEPPAPEAPAMTTPSLVDLAANSTSANFITYAPGTTASTSTSATYAGPDAMPADGMPPSETPPAPALTDIADTELEAEIARRAAQAAADAGAGTVEELLPDAQDEAAGMIDEITSELTGETEPAAPPPPADSPVLAAQLAAGGEAGLPLAARDATWDAAAADGRVSELASSDGSGDPDTLDWNEYGRAFFWHEPNANTKAQFKLQFADVVNGRLEAVPAGVFACAAVLQGGRGGVDIPDADVDAVKSRVNGYYQAMRDAWSDDSVVAPWETAVAGPAAFADDGSLLPDSADAPMDAPAEEYDWEGVLALEGIPTSDGRMFSEGALTWRTLPLTLSLQTVTAEGHDGGVVCGSICEIERVGQTIVGRGRFSSTDPGQLARTLIEEGSLRGVSIDVASAVVVYTDENGDEVSLEDVWFGDIATTAVFVEAELMGAHLTPFPAFSDAHVGLIEDPTSLVATGTPGCWRLTGPALFRLVDGAPDTAALVASAAPTAPAPPEHLFALKPNTTQPFTVGTPLPDGTVPCYGLLAAWNRPHIGFGGRKVYPPRGDDFAHFYTGKHVLTREGTRISTGPIFVDTVHPNLAAQASDAQAFYAHTGSAVADVHLYEGELGIVAAGVLRPDVDEVTARRLRGSDVSPDWRPIEGRHRMVAILAVNASGFVVPFVEGIAASAGRVRPWVAYDDTTGEPLAMVAVGAMHREPSPGEVLADLRATVAAQQTRLDAMEAQQATFAALAATITDPPALPAPEPDDGPVELSADERAARTQAAMAALGIDRESRAARARAALGLEPVS